MAELKKELSEQLHLSDAVREILRIDESLLRVAEQLTKEAVGDMEAQKSAVAVICAMAAIEARINYVLDDWLNSQGKNKDEIDELLYQWGIAKKVTEKLREAKGKSLEDEKDLFERFKEMKRFREALMHHKGRNIPGERSQKYAAACMNYARAILSFIEGN